MTDTNPTTDNLTTRSRQQLQPLQPLQQLQTLQQFPSTFPPPSTIFSQLVAIKVNNNIFVALKILGLTQDNLWNKQLYISSP
jgi:hypothetical protein